MPEAVLEDRMDTTRDDVSQASSSSSSSSSLPLDSPFYRFYSTDENGSLKVSHPHQEGEILLTVSPTQKNAVHKMAKGRLADDTEVLALARQNGRIDLVSCKDGKKLITLRVERMKENVHRWVGLAVASNCIYSCTSAGIMTQTLLEVAKNGLVTKSSEVSLTLPEPLQCCEFEPKIEPKFFAYGGEDVALSVCDVDRFFSKQMEKDTQERSEDSQYHTVDVEGNNGDQTEMSSEDKKRKRAAERRSKAKELMQGEVWRAKNLPMSMLHLPVRASIVSIAFLAETKLVVGTKQGSLRLYEVGPQRKAIKEINLLQPKGDAVKHLVCSHNKGEMIAADTVGRVYVVNWHTGAIVYTYETFAGAVVSLCSVPPSKGAKQTAHLLTASAEKLLRLHDMPMNSNLPHKTKQKGKIVSTQFHPKGIRNILWDGKIPNADVSDVEGAVQEGDDEPAANEHDDVWQSMATVGEEEHEDEHRSQRRRTQQK